MKHPFANNTELSQTTTQAISTGDLGTAPNLLSGLVPCDYKAQIVDNGNEDKTTRPPIGSTMAMGEEGGGRFHYY